MPICGNEISMKHRGREREIGRHMHPFMTLKAPKYLEGEAMMTVLLHRGAQFTRAVWGMAELKDAHQ